MDRVCSDQLRLHEPADAGARGADHQPQEAIQPRPQPRHQQVYIHPNFHSLIMIYLYKKRYLTNLKKHLKL